MKQMTNPVAKLTMPIGIPTKEAKAKMETHQPTVELKHNSKLYKLFYASYSLIRFDLFLQLNNFSLHLYFSV